MNNEDITNMQEAWLTVLCLYEQVKGKGGQHKQWVTREFFMRSMGMLRWQHYHTRLINDLVALGWLIENVAPRGSMQYQLTDAGWQHVAYRIDDAGKFASHFAVQNDRLTD